MTELLTAAQMRAIEQAAIESGEVTGLELMERAGQGVVEAIFEEWPELAEPVADARGAGRSSSIGRSDQWRNQERPPEYLGKDEKRRAVVLCGPGNNGGDGFVVARLLRARGWAVEVFLYGDPDKLPPDAKVNYDRFSDLQSVGVWDDRGIRELYEGDEDSRFLIIDALFGTGLARAMPEDTQEMWEGFMPSPLTAADESGAADCFVAIDIPSGICSDSGRDFGALPSNLTVTFHRAKIGHHMSQGCWNYGGALGCGKLVVKSIGLEGSSSPRVGVKPPPVGAAGGCPAMPPGESGICFKVMVSLRCNLV